MKIDCRATISVAVICATLFTLAQARAAESSPTDEAKAILDATGTTGGIVVHLGCGDGRLTAALRAGEAFTVIGLDADPDKVAQARSRVDSLGVYGPVSIERFSAAELPYTENLVNLVVVEDQGKVSADEIQRVLVPGGVAYVKQGVRWIKTVKPRPGNIDDWSHFLHDASGNAVADDTVVGPPRSLQWICPPLWLRSHETPSGVQAPVTAGGRLFYYFDEGLIGITDERLPDRWSLVCRDAFNGTLLWTRPLEAWGWHEWNREDYEGKDWTVLRGKRTDVPSNNQRLIVADDQRVYATLTYRGALSIIDAASGEIISTVDAAAGTSEILVSDGVVLCYTEQGESESAQRRGADQQVTAALVAVEATTGRVLWRKAILPIVPLGLAIDDGRVVFVSKKIVTALDFKDGSTLWEAESELPSTRTLLISDGVVVMHSGTKAAALDATDGRLLWKQSGPSIGGGEGDDLFVVDGLVWRGMISVDDNGKPVGKSPNSLVVGWDLRTGEERKEILVNNLRSPEHHHRCYRNKATSRYLISSFEGAEYLDFHGTDHSPNNFLRGACKNGMMPANGMLYVPPDQCFCQPGAKLLGYSAVKTAPEVALEEVPDRKRLEKGPAYGQPIANSKSLTPSPADWPTFRHDAARSGASPEAVEPNLSIAWKTKLDDKLTAPVAAGGRVFVAKSDAHTVYALDAKDGNVLWQFTAAGRVDSPPTIHGDLVLFGSKDGRVYCLSAADGQLVWRFLAAPLDRRVGYFNQVESAWPVHGSVLIDRGVAYFTAGRSTYLDGGIRVWGLDPASGEIVHKGLLEGPHRSVAGQRDVAFYVLGANSDVLVSEGGFIYMRQKKMTPELDEIAVDVLSSKGAQDVGLHVFSTAGLLDDSWYNRTFWMYSKRWPGFQLANQASKAGQLLVVDDEKTYALRVFYRRNTHSPMFFPGADGYLIFADDNGNEPQIVGDEGSVEPLRWLPQSDYSRGRGDEMRELGSDAFGGDKGIGYTRAKPPEWMQWLPVRVRAMAKAGDTLFAAGVPDVLDPEDPYAAFENRRGARLVSLAASDGKPLSEIEIGNPPVFDGLIAAGGRIYVSQTDGSLLCLGPQR